MNARGRWNCGSMSDLSSLLSRKDHRRREREEGKIPMVDEGLPLYSPKLRIK
jgi:hypothetical protein